MMGAAGAQDTPDQEPAGHDGLAEAAASFVAAPTVLPVPIVAIGASAGGLEALEQFFAAVEVPSSFAFVVVRQLSPDFKSLMVELLARRTALAVRVVEDGMRPAANAIHLIPPGKTMTIEGGIFRLAARDPRDFAHQPVDEFFVSLAADQGAAATGIVLSGSGSDGSRGARALRAVGGRVLVQLPATARFSGMPQGAIESGCAAEIMVPAAMAAALSAPGPWLPAEAGAARAMAIAPAIGDCLARAFGIDLARYRADAVQRRVQRRMMLRGFDQMAVYAAFVADDEAEQEALYHDLMLGPTTFFPDQAAVDALERAVVPVLVAELDAGRPVRIWVPGCATGEEAYGIAILLLAGCRQPLDDVGLEVHATDIHRRSLAIATAGFYSEEAVANVPAAWRERFFTRRGSGYQVISCLADRVAFSVHDLLDDPPFARLHLISCQGVLGRFTDEAQTRVLGHLATALLPEGCLLVGSGEIVEGRSPHFAAVDTALRLHRRLGPAPAGRPADAASIPPIGEMSAPTQSHTLTIAAGGSSRGERRDPRLIMAQELLLDRHAPPSLLLDEAGQVLHSFGDAGAWLAMPGDGGGSSLNVLDMVRQALRPPLAAALEQARATGRPVTLDQLPPDTPPLRRLVVEALLARPDGQRCFLVSFEARPA